MAENAKTRGKLFSTLIIAIVEVQPEDTRPFAEYLKCEVNSPDIPSLCYKVALYKQEGHKRTQLQLPKSEIKIRQNQQYKHLVGLTCFYYADSCKFLS